MNIAALRRAVQASAAWRGSLVGDPDPRQLEAFDLETAKQYKALKNAARLRHEHQMLLLFIKRLADLPEKADHPNTALSAVRRQARTLMGIVTNPYT